MDANRGPEDRPARDPGEVSLPAPDRPRVSAETPERAAFGALLALLLVVLSLCAVVALETGGMRLVQPPADLDGRLSWAIRLGGVALGGLGLALLLGFRRVEGGSSRGRLEAESTPRSLRTAAMLMGVLALLALLVAPPLRDPSEGRFNPRPSSSQNRERDESGAVGSSSSGSMAGTASMGGGGGGGGGPGGAPGAGVAGGARPSLLQRVARNLPLLLLLAVAALAALILLRRRRRGWEPFPDELLLDPEEAEASLEASLDGILRGRGPPGERVTAAYRRLLLALAGAGAPRRSQEAPHEHLSRVLGPLGIPPEPLHELADLYVVAQFSRRPVTEEHRERAIRCLEISLFHLRRARGDAGPSGEGVAVALGSG